MLPLITRKEFRRTLALEARRHRDEEGLVLIEGARLVLDAIACGAEVSWCVVDGSRAERHAALIEACARGGIPVYAASERDARRLSEVEHAQGVLAVARRPEDRIAHVFAAAPRGPVTVLWEVADPGNVGTILRTCDWFGAPAVLLSQGSVDPANPKAVRASMGSYFRVAVARFDDPAVMVEEARARGFRILAADAHGTAPMPAGRADAPALVFFGSEAHGLPPHIRDLCDASFAIPARGGAESLNLAVAHGVVLSHAVQ